MNGDFLNDKSGSLQFVFQYIVVGSFMKRIEMTTQQKQQTPTQKWTTVVF
jgi:hypothetical protein